MVVTDPHAPGDEDPRDAVWLQAAGRGDRDAFEALYDRYAAPIAAFLFGFLQDAALAEDVTQETFLRAWRAAPRWHPEARVSTWLFTIARHAGWKHARRRRRRPVREAEAARRAGAPALPDPARRAAESEERLREQDRLLEALGSLSPKLRLVFVLVRLLGRSYAEAAEIARVPLGTAKSRMYTAETLLRSRLTPPDDR